jgi:acyl carrier protein
MDIIVELKNLIDVKDKDSLTLETNLRDLGIDSLELLDFILEIEDKFNIEIDDDALIQMSTIGDVVNAVQIKIK